MTFVIRTPGPEVGAMAGQSNSLGRMASPTVPDLTIPRSDIRYWYHDMPFLRPVIAQDLDDYAPSQWVGGEIGLGVGMADGGRSAYAVSKTARGSTGLVLAVQWAPSSATGELSKALRSIRALLDRLVHNIVTQDPRVGVLVWNQWEQDGLSVDDSAAYQTNLTALIQRFRDEFHPALPVIVTMASPLATSRPAANITTIRAAQLAVAASDPLVVTIETSDLAVEGDNTHYTPDAQQILGARVLAAALAFAQPDYTPGGGLVTRVSFYGSLGAAREVQIFLNAAAVLQGPVDVDIFAVQDRFGYHHVPTASWLPV